LENNSHVTAPDLWFVMIALVSTPFRRIACGVCHPYGKIATAL
jgi:hypothetical protein